MSDGPTSRQRRRKRLSVVLGVTTAMIAQLMLLPAASFATTPTSRSVSPSAATAAPAGHDVALDGVATAKSEYPAAGFAATNVNDGDPTTRWGSKYEHVNPTIHYDPTTDWIQIHLAEASRIDHVVLVWEDAYASSFIIQGSNNGTTWTDLKAVTDGTGGTETVQIGSTVAYSYVRMQGEKTATKYGYSIYSFEVWNGPEATPQPAPDVVPPMTDWTAGDGSFTLAADSRIVVDSAHQSQLLADAKTMASDLVDLGVRSLPVVSAEKATAHDIFLTLGATSDAESYALSVDDAGVVIRGTDAAGVFYGEQSVEQILGSSPDKSTVPFGSADDAPAQQERGLMLDSARKYWTIDSIEQTIRQMAWMKLNTLHWHVTDSEYFRLDLPGYHDLAAAKSYDLDDIHAIEAYAARFHVTVLPELDIPGHATSITQVHPDMRWSCASMNSIISPGRVDPGFTIDITKSDNVAWLDKLVTTVAKAFDSPLIHLGGDETPNASLQASCPELADYAADKGYSKTEDVFLAFENHLDDLLKKQGKSMEMWGWWPQAGGAGSVTANKDIRIQAWLGDESTFIAQGYDVVVSNEHSRLYVVPKYAPGTANGNYIPDDSALYSSYSLSDSDQVKGIEMAEWGDNAYTMPDAYPLSYLARPLQVLASVGWGSPRLSSYLDYELLADRVGSAPGTPIGVDPTAVPTAGALTGDTAAAAALDGDVSTAYTAASAGAWFGEDLGAGSTASLAGVRVLPRSTSSADLGSLVGGTVQGCTDGPDSGCHTLATITWTPTRDWQTIPVNDSTAYRWVRFVAASGAKPAISELQFLTSPSSVSVDVKPVGPVPAGSTKQVTVTVTNRSGKAIDGARVGLEATNTLDNTSLSVSKVAPLSVAAGATANVTATISSTSSSSPGQYRVVATVDAGGRSMGAAAATVPYANLQQAYGNVGVSSDDNPQPGDIDGAQSSFSAQALKAAGADAGGVIEAGGGAFLGSWDGKGTPDNALAAGQTIPVTGTASTVYLLVTGTYAPSAGIPGTVTVTYADGSTADAAIAVPDWASTTAPPDGVTVAVDAGTTNANGRAQAQRPTKLYVLSLPVDKTKKLASVTLPDGAPYTIAKGRAIHVFAISTDAAAADLTKTTPEGTPVRFAVAGAPILDEAVTAQTSDATASGTWTVDGGDVVFTPASGFTGTVHSPYRLADANNGVSAPGTLTVTVTADDSGSTPGGGTGSTSGNGSGSTTPGSAGGQHNGESGSADGLASTGSDLSPWLVALAGILGAGIALMAASRRSTRRRAGRR